jgi:hypothetical protein
MVSGMALKRKLTIREKIRIIYDVFGNSHYIISDFDL